MNTRNHFMWMLFTQVLWLSLMKTKKSVNSSKERMMYYQEASFALFAKKWVLSRRRNIYGASQTSIQGQKPRKEKNCNFCVSDAKSTFQENSTIIMLEIIPICQSFS